MAAPERQHAAVADAVGERAERGLQRGNHQPERQVHQQDVLEFEAARDRQVLDPDAEPEPELHEEQERVVEALVAARGGGEVSRHG